MQTDETYQYKKPGLIKNYHSTVIVRIVDDSTPFGYRMIDENNISI